MPKKFLSARRLGIRERERAALIKVMRNLRSGNLERRKRDEDGDSFNLSCAAEKRKRGCGTVACIGGWMALYMGMSLEEAESYVMENFSVEYEPETKREWLGHLFYGRGLGLYLSSVKPLQAAESIRIYLTTGQVDWKQAMKNARAAAKRP